MKLSNNKYLLAIVTTLTLQSVSLADSISSNLQASAELSSTCSISANDADFSFSPTSTATYLKTQVTILTTCSKGTTVSLHISAGNSGDYKIEICCPILEKY